MKPQRTTQSLITSRLACLAILILTALLAGCGTRLDFHEDNVKWSGTIGLQNKLPDGNQLLVRVSLLPPPGEIGRNWATTPVLKDTSKPLEYKYEVEVRWYPFAHYQLDVVLIDPSGAESSKAMRTLAAPSSKDDSAVNFTDVTL